MNPTRSPLHLGVATLVLAALATAALAVLGLGPHRVEHASASSGGKTGVSGNPAQGGQT